MTATEGEIPKIAILGSGIFVRTQYIPRLREIADLVVIKTIWSRSEDSAKAAAELARDFSPNIEIKWGDAGLDDIIQDGSIHGVAIVLAGQVQVDMSLKMLKAGKHVIQEKPACGSTSEAEAALSSYESLCSHFSHQPIWAVAENYRFEPAFAECRKLLNDIGEMMNIQVIVESSMNSSNPYFSSSWRRNFTGGFILDMGVHFIAGLRMPYNGGISHHQEIKPDTSLLTQAIFFSRLSQLAGCEIATVSAIARHVDTNLPPPDNLCSLFQLENGCAGVFVMAVSSPSPKIYWRVDGTKGTVQIERGVENGRHGYTVLFYTTDGPCRRAFHPFSGVNEELKAFVRDIKQATNKYPSTRHQTEPRSSYLEGVRDVAVLEAMLESSSNNGARVPVKSF